MAEKAPNFVANSYRFPLLSSWQINSVTINLGVKP